MGTPVPIVVLLAVSSCIVLIGFSHQLEIMLMLRGKAATRSFLERLSVPGHLCMYPIAGSELFDVIASEKRHHLLMLPLK